MTWLTGKVPIPHNNFASGQGHDLIALQFHALIWAVIRATMHQSLAECYLSFWINNYQISIGSLCDQALRG